MFKKLVESYMVSCFTERWIKSFASAIIKTCCVHLRNAFHGRVCTVLYVNKVYLLVIHGNVYVQVQIYFYTTLSLPYGVQVNASRRVLSGNVCLIVMFLVIIGYSKLQERCRQTTRCKSFNTQCTYGLYN